MGRALSYSCAGHLENVKHATRVRPMHDRPDHEGHFSFDLSEAAAPRSRSWPWLPEQPSGKRDLDRQLISDTAEAVTEAQR